MRVAFISSSLSLTGTGGGVASRRNLQLLKKYYSGTQDTITTISFKRTNPDTSIDYSIYPPRNKYLTMFNMLLGYQGGVSRSNISSILKIIKTHKIQLVFLDSSLLGSIAKIVSTISKKIDCICFYHNDEVQFVSGMVKSGKWWYFPLVLGTIYQQRLCVKWCTQHILLTRDDAYSVFKKQYSQSNYTIIPISVPSQGQIMYDYSIPSGEKLVLLFVGSPFYANQYGIKWFVDKVLPHVDMTLTIVGRSWDEHNYLRYNNKVMTPGYIENIGDIYANSDIVISPIFHGSGMKVKIAEALSYGKKIVGTNLSFVGYDKHEIDSIVIVKGAVDYIEKLNSCAVDKKRKKYYKSSVVYHSKNNSFASCYQKFFKFMNTISKLKPS
jgi:polysaccharide biosynthesis protein PslH